MIRLYHRWKCPWCAAARQAIENVGVEVELVEVPYPRPERLEVIAVSGQARVPVLVDGDEVIVDSRRIVRHLYERYGGPAFAASAADLAREELADGEDWEPEPGELLCARGEDGHRGQRSPGQVSAIDQSSPSPSRSR